MTRRIFVTVKRGITDATAVCIYPWEKQILERIHGGEVEETTIDEMCDLKGPVKVEKLKFSRSMEEGAKPESAPSLREQLEAMVVITDEEDPANDPDAEYGRLEVKYGMDKEVPMPVVTIVYGQLNSGAFGAALKEAQKAAAKQPRSAGVREQPGKAIADMSINELRAECRRQEIDFDQTARKPDLVDLLTTATA